MQKSVLSFFRVSFLVGLPLYAISAVMLFPSVSSATNVPVPNVTGKTQTEAEDLLKAGGFQVAVKFEDSGPEQDKKVIRSSPSAGSTVSQGSTIRLTVGRDDTVSVPNVIGTTQDTARSMLSSADLKTRWTAMEVFTIERDKKVVGCNPAPGTRVRKRTEVLVTTGWKRARTLPNVIGKTQSEAEASLRAEKFRMWAQYEEITSSQGSNNTAIRTDPQAGFQTQRDDFPVKVTIGRIRRIAVPDVTQKYYSEAKQTLESAGFKTTYVTESTDDRSMNDKVIRTDPRAGTSIEQGSTIRLTVARVRRVRIPNVVGKTEAEAKQSLESVGLRGYVVTQDTTDRAQDKKVIRTGFAAGPEVQVGSFINLFVGKWKEVITPFNTTLAEFYLTVGDSSKDTANIPPAGWVYPSDGPVKIEVAIGLETPGGKVDKAYVSKNSGASWQLCAPTGVRSLTRTLYKYSFDASPGETVELIAFKAEGYDTDSTGKTIGAVKTRQDSRSTRVIIKRPSAASNFAATFKNGEILVGNLKKSFSDVPDSGIVYPSNARVKLRVTIDLTVTGGRLFIPYVSADGGKSWLQAQSEDSSRIFYDAPAEPGDFNDFIFRAEGYNLDADGNPTGAVQSVSDKKHVKVKIKSTLAKPFDASITETFLYRDLSGGPTKFSGLPPAGIDMEVPRGSKEYVSVAVGVGWIVKGGKLKAIGLSKDGGVTWGSSSESAATSPRPVTFGIVVYPPAGKTDFLFRLEGQDTNERGEPIGDVHYIPDRFHAIVNVKEKAPVITPFAAEFTEHAFYTGPMLNEKKPFSDMEFEVPKGSKEWVNVNIGVAWKITSGQFKDFYISNDGGNHWERIAGSKSPATLGVSVYPPLGTREYVFKVEGYNTDEQGKPIGELKPVIDKARAKVNVKEKVSIVTTSDEKSLQVADVIGRTESEARKVLESLGYKVSWNETSTTNPKEDDRVVNVTPQTGSKLRTGETVTLTMARYMPTVPQAIGLSEDDAVEQLRENTFKARVTYADTQNLREEGRVIKTLPSGGVTLAKNATVELFVGKKASTGGSAEKVLLEMVSAYQNEDFSGLASRVSEDFPNGGEMEEFIRRDFRDYDGIKLNLFIKRTVDLPTGADVEADWELQCVLTEGARQLRIRGEGLHFIFSNSTGQFKLAQMRGENPLFGARSPDVAAASGAPASVTQVLQKIQDSGSRAAKQGALGVVASDVVTGQTNIPVTFEIVTASAHYTNGAREEVDFDAIQPLRPGQLQATIRILDNPKKIDFTGIKLQVTDSNAPSESFAVTGDVQADQTVTFLVVEPIGFESGQTGTLTFVLDPEDKFISIDREKKTEKISYTVL